MVSADAQVDVTIAHYPVHIDCSPAASGEAIMKIRATRYPHVIRLFTSEWGAGVSQLGWGVDPGAHAVGKRTP